MQIKTNNPGAALANSMSFMDDNMGDGVVSGLTPLQEKVFKILQTGTSTTGMERSAILKHFPSGQHREVK